MVPLSGTETMHDQKDFSRYSDPAWSFYAEPLTSFPLLALVDEDWMPFSFKANTKSHSRYLALNQRPSLSLALRNVFAIPSE